MSSTSARRRARTATDHRRLRRRRARHRREAAGAVARRARRRCASRRGCRPPARGRLPAAHRHGGGTCPAPAAGRAPSGARCSPSARRSGSAMTRTSPCRGAASGRPRAAARRWATASISSTCSPSCSATGRASRGGCGDSTARPRPRTPRPRRSCSRTARSPRSCRAPCRLARRARSASTPRRRRSRSTIFTATVTRTGRSRRRPHVTEEESARWALPAVEERSDHGPLLRDVFDALLAGEPLPQTADAPARSFELVAAIYASAAADGAVVTPADLAAHPLIARASRARSPTSAACRAERSGTRPPVLRN